MSGLQQQFGRRLHEPVGPTDEGVNRSAKLFQQRLDGRQVDTSVGLYGVVSYETIRRTHEIGIRMALGARRSDVLRLVMRQTVVVVTIGAGIGVALALAASRLIGSLLFGIGPSDPVAIGSALAVLIGVALAASYLPARRASQLDPTQALRYE